MKKKLISLLQRKRHIVALSTILMTFIVMSCLFYRFCRYNPNDRWKSRKLCKGRNGLLLSKCMTH